MSIFPNPWQPVTSAEDWNRMSEEFAGPLRKDIAAAMGLMANPVASFAAMSALGFGLASHAFGVWAGAVAGAAQASQRFFAPFDLGEGSPAAQPKETKHSTAAVVAMPTRPKPALKIVPKAEPAAPTPVVEPTELVVEPAAASAAKPAKAELAEPAKTAAAKPAKAKTVEPAKARATAPAKAKIAEPVKAAVAESAKSEASQETSRKPRTIERPATPDDLKAISGIGPKLEKVLNDLGVWTYAQIAAWSKEEIAWVDDYLSFKGRIDRDGWIAQAAKLADVSRDN